MWHMVCLTVHLVYVDFHEVLDISLFSYIQPCRINVFYDLPKLFLVCFLQNISIIVQYMHALSPV